MATLQAALPTIFMQEGLLSDNKKDPGGITNYGISLRFLLKTGDLDKDGIRDGDIDDDGDIDSHDIRLMSLPIASKLYDMYFWRPNRYYDIDNQDIATKMLSLAINMGARAANKCLQTAINNTINRTSIRLNKINIDGIIGDNTIKSCNGLISFVIDRNYLFMDLEEQAANYYRSIKYKGSEDFLQGWLNRAYA